MYCSRLLIPPKKVLILARIELESARSPVCSADHSATLSAQIYFLYKNYSEYVPLSTPWRTPMEEVDTQQLRVLSVNHNHHN